MIGLAILLVLLVVYIFGVGFNLLVTDSAEFEVISKSWIWWSWLPWILAWKRDWSDLVK